MAMRKEADEARAEFAAASADKLYTALFYLARPRPEFGEVKIAVLLAELNSRLHQLEGWQMGAEEPAWKKFSERHPETVEPLLVRWPDKDCGGYIYNVFQVGLTEKRLAEEGAKYAKMEMEWMVIPNG